MSFKLVIFHQDPRTASCWCRHTNIVSGSVVGGIREINQDHWQQCKTWLWWAFQSWEKRRLWSENSLIWRGVASYQLCASSLIALFPLSLCLCSGFDEQQTLGGLAAFNSQLGALTWDRGRGKTGEYKALQSWTDLWCSSPLWICIWVCACVFMCHRL